MYSFAKQICEASKLNFKPETINTASKEYAKNPRRIIQLFNNLLAEMNNYTSDFIQKNETLICCILIIREEYPEYYKKIINSPKIFNEDYSGEEENIKRFSRIAHTNLGNVAISDLSIILTNSYRQFDDIAEDIRDAIETFNTEKVLSVWNKEKDHVVNYIFYELDNSIKNNLIDTNLVAYFDLIAQINIKYPLEEHLTKRIDEKTQPYLSTIITKTKNHDNLCKYAQLREEQKDERIKIALVEDCKRDENQEESLHWKSLFNTVIKNFQDKETSIALSSTYTLYYYSVGSVDFSEEQIESLFSDQFVKQRIENLPYDNNNEISLNTETKEYQKVKWLFEKKKNITDETYGHFFIKVVGNDSNGSRMRGKSIDEIAKILDFTNPILNLIPDRKLTEQPQLLYDLIINNRQISNPNYRQNIHPQQSPQYLSKNFIDECLNETKYISEITEFVINIYRISNNKTSVVEEIDKLLKHTHLNKEFIQLINKQYSLLPILDLIFDDNNDFSNNDTLTILKHCFHQKKNKGEYTIAEEKAKTKLNGLLIYAQTEKSKEVFYLLETLIEQERYKNLLTDLIIEKDSSFVNSLPSKFLKLAVSSFNRNNYNDYSNNFDFLSVITQNGNNTQKRHVIKILTEKLDKNQDIESVLHLISSMENIPSFDEAGLLSSHLDNYQRQNKDNISQEINDRINQLKIR